MNVLIVTFLVPTSPSGVVTYCKTLTADLASEGVNAGVIDSSQMPEYWRKFIGLTKRLIRPFGKPVHALFQEFVYFMGIYLAVRRQRSTGFDLIHAQDARSGVAARLALGKKVPVVLTCHFNDDPVTEIADMFALKGWAAGRLMTWYKYLFAQINNYIFVSHYAYEKSKHLFPEKINKQILHNTIRLQVPTDRPARDASGRVLISNVGYIDERKNQKLLLEVGHELRNRGIDNFAIWLIGDGPKRQEYEQLALDFNLNEHVTFYGRQSAPWQLVAQSDLYIHTALNDNCPYSIIEAFAVHTPVLALPVGGVPELVPSPSSGQLVGTDVDQITDEVITYFSPQERTRLAQQQAEYAHIKLNHQTALRQLISFYQQSLSY